MELRIDRQALVPVVQQIVDALTCWLHSSGVSPGTRLPSVRQIARINLLSQSSVAQACERLVTQGMLEREIAKAKLPYNVNLVTLVAAEVVMGHAETIARRSAAVVWASK